MTIVYKNGYTEPNACLTHEEDLEEWDPEEIPNNTKYVVCRPRTVQAIKEKIEKIIPDRNIIVFTWTDDQASWSVMDDNQQVEEFTQA